MLLRDKRTLHIQRNRNRKSRQLISPLMIRWYQLNEVMFQVGLLTYSLIFEAKLSYQGHFETFFFMVYTTFNTDIKKSFSSVYFYISSRG